MARHCRGKNKRSVHPPPLPHCDMSITFSVPVTYGLYCTDGHACVAERERRLLTFFSLFSSSRCSLHTHLTPHPIESIHHVWTFPTWWEFLLQPAGVLFSYVLGHSTPFIYTNKHKSLCISMTCLSAKRHCATVFDFQSLSFLTITSSSEFWRLSTHT